MPTVVNYNRFPAGNLGGLLTRKHGTDSRLAHIALFMPPFKQQEVLLNIPMMPKKAFIDTGEMRPVLSMEGNGAASRWKLRVASRDSNGQNVWSPFTFANVWQDARICWGNGNQVPTTFARAWTDFWTAPFNRDLAADVPIREFGWWYENHKRHEQQKSWPVRAVRLFERTTNNPPGERRLNPGRWLAPNAQREFLHGRIDKLRDALYTFDGVRKELARRGREGCANRGVAFVAVNHKAYMRALNKYNALKIEYDAAISELNAMDNAGHDLENAIAQHAGEFSARLYRHLVHGERLYHDTLGRPRENHNYYAERVKPAMKNFRRFYRGSMLPIRAFWRYKIRMYFLECFRANDDQEAHAEYRTWQQEQLAKGLNAHFCENAWTKTLVFRQITSDLAGWGTTIPFPACDGVCSIPFEAARPIPLPSYEDMFTIYDDNGRAFQMSAPAKFALFRNVSEKVKFLFVPGSENVFLTNGKTIKPVDDATFAEVLAELEAEDISKFNAVRYLEGIGYYLTRVESLDLSRRVKEDPNDLRADDDADPDEGNDDDDPDEEEDDEARNERRLAELRREIDRSGGCTCTVCRNRCGCDECFAETDAHDDDDGNHVAECDCRACQWISNGSTTGSTH